MQFKRYLLTPLLFAQMWVGAGVLPLKTNPIQEASTSVTLKVVQESPVKTVKIEEDTVLAVCLLALLVGIVLCGKKIFTNARMVFKIKKEHEKSYFKESFLNRSFSKSKNAYYWHFYSALNFIKSA